MDERLSTTTTICIVLRQSAGLVPANSTLRTLSYEYDVASQLTSASDPAASYSYSYDNLGRVTQLSQTLAGLTPTIVLAQNYDVRSLRTQLSRRSVVPLTL